MAARSNVVSLRDPRHEEFSTAIQAWVNNKRVTDNDNLTPGEVSNLAAFDRVDVMRKSQFVGMVMFCRSHPLTDATLAVYHLIMLMSDNDSCACSLSQRQIAKIFGRTEKTIGEVIGRLCKARLIVATTKVGCATSYSPVLMRVASQNNRMCLIESAKTTPHGTVGGVGKQPILDKTPHGTVPPTEPLPPTDRGAEPPTDRDRHSISLRGNSLKEDIGAFDAASGIRSTVKTVFVASGITLGTITGLAAEPVQPPPTFSVEINAGSAEVAEPAIIQPHRKASDQEATRLPKGEEWRLPRDWGQWAMHNCNRDEAWVRMEADKFKKYWLSVPDSKGFKKNWKATWQKWCRNALQREAKFNGGAPFRPKTKEPVRTWQDRERDALHEALMNDPILKKYEGRVIAPREES